jgi:hypothetical protein
MTVTITRRDTITLLSGATSGGRLIVRVNRRRAGTGRFQ